MSFYTYDGTDHKSGYIGHRISVMIDGKQKQKYYSTRGKSIEEANILAKEAHRQEQEWLMIKNMSSSVRESSCVDQPNKMKVSCNATGVTGVKLIFRGNSIGGMRTPYISINFNYRKVRYAKAINVRDQGYMDAWNQAILFYATSREITDYSHLLKRRPPIEIWYVIFMEDLKKGDEMKISHLPKELLKSKFLDKWFDFIEDIAREPFKQSEYLKKMVHKYKVNKTVKRMNKERRNEEL